ncbi:archaetidylserine decarboxylase [Pendulispora rubella]|uniref:phosphatidylserine decarboxylase n=1 Tax=Pendulispora rubella TaxID=2741070 RepID=A0ABZ2KXT2_9BACT
MPGPIRYIDRESQGWREEPLAFGGFLPWLYSDGVVARTTRYALTRRAATRVYGWLQERPTPVERLRAFCESLGIDAEEAAEPLSEYRSLSSFFSRRLKRDARPVVSDARVLVSPADARVFVVPVLDGERLPIKGGHFTLAELVDDPRLAARFAKGAAVVLRLAPADYHRFHFPDDGDASEVRAIEGGYDSVNHYALDRAPGILCRNHRHVTLLRSRHFGDMLIVEVGALFCGAIVQTYRAGNVTRGAEKGYFRLGGSSMVLVLPPGRVRFDDDLVAASQSGHETRVRMGTSLGRAC